MIQTVCYFAVFKQNGMELKFKQSHHTTMAVNIRRKMAEIAVVYIMINQNMQTMKIYETDTMNKERKDELKIIGR